MLEDQAGAEARPEQCLRSVDGPPVAQRPADHPGILERVRRSAVLLLVLSPGYVELEWCRRELDAFVRASEGRAGHVFVVELIPVDQTDLPASLADRKRVTFWREDRRTCTPRVLGTLMPDVEYYEVVDDLIRDIVTSLKELKHVQSQSQAPASITGTGTVFLAEVTDDLDEQRNNVRRYLDQAASPSFRTTPVRSIRTRFAGQ